MMSLGILIPPLECGLCVALFTRTLESRSLVTLGRHIISGGTCWGTLFKRYLQSTISRNQKPTNKMVYYYARKSTYKLHGIHLLSCYTSDLVCLLQKILSGSTHTFLSFHYQCGAISSYTQKFTYLNPIENISWCHNKPQVNVRSGEELAWRSVCPTSILVGRSLLQL